ASSAQSAAISELLPVPTGPPTPIRIGRLASGGKQPPSIATVAQRAQLDKRRRNTRQLARCDGRGGARGAVLDLGGERRDPAESSGCIDRQQLDGGGRHCG